MSKSKLTPHRTFLGNRGLLVISMAIMVLIGFVIWRSFASGTQVASEPEKAKVTSPAATGTDSAASGGSYTKFGSNSGSKTVVAAGDLVWNGSLDRSLLTAKLVKDINPEAVLTIGDHAYTYNQDFQFDKTKPYPAPGTPCAANTAKYFDHWGVFRDPADGLSYDIRAKTFPAIGNHEYFLGNFSGGCGHSGKPTTDPAQPFWNYFADRIQQGAAGTAGNLASRKGYYSFNMAGWHIIALNSNCGMIRSNPASRVPGGCASDAEEYRWLQADLNANTQSCTLAYFHQPVWQEGKTWDHKPPGFATTALDRAPDAAAAQADLADEAAEYAVDTVTGMSMRIADSSPASAIAPAASTASVEMYPMTKLLQAKKADVVLVAHTHIYEHFKPMSLDAGNHVNADPNGLTTFVVGTGGATMSWLTPANYVDTAHPGSFSSNLLAHSVLPQDHGVLKMTLRPGGMDYKFLGITDAVTNKIDDNSTKNGPVVCHAKS